MPSRAHRTTIRGRSRRITSRHRRGFALADAIIGGILLSIGLGTLISLSTRAIAMQADGANRITAAWLADEILALVVVEGPEYFGRMHDMADNFSAPFEQYEYAVDISSQGARLPFQVTVTVWWPGANPSVRLETLVTQPEEDPLPREPLEPLDRQDRWDERLNAGEYADGG